jgi:hypothetical protein
MTAHRTACGRRRILEGNMQVGDTTKQIFSLLDKAQLRQNVLAENRRLAETASSAPTDQTTKAAAPIERNGSDRIALSDTANMHTSSGMEGIDDYADILPSGLYFLDRLASIGLQEGYIDAVLQPRDTTTSMSAVRIAYQDAAALAE